MTSQSNYPVMLSEAWTFAKRMPTRSRSNPYVRRDSLPCQLDPLFLPPQREDANSTASPQQSPPAIFPSAPFSPQFHGECLHNMANPGDFAYTVKQQADIVRIIGDYVKLKKAGGAKLLRPLSVSRRKNAVILRPRHAPVLSLLRLRPLRATSSASSRKSKTSPSPNAVRLVAQKLGIPLPKPAMPPQAKPKKPACAASYSTFTSAPSRSSRNASAAPKAQAPANISKAAA